MEKRLFTSESVTEGHPDKICDNISDGILDALMEQDPMSRVACETAITTDYVLIMGEITTKAKVDYEKIARETIREIGYDSDEKGFNCDTCRVKVLLDSQSPDTLWVWIRRWRPERTRCQMSSWRRSVQEIRE